MCCGERMRAEERISRAQNMDRRSSLGRMVWHLLWPVRPRVLVPWPHAVHSVAPDVVEMVLTGLRRGGRRATGVNQVAHRRGSASQRNPARCHTRAQPAARQLTRGCRAWNPPCRHSSQSCSRRGRTCQSAGTGGQRGTPGRSSTSCRKCRCRPCCNKRGICEGHGARASGGVLSQGRYGNPAQPCSPGAADTATGCRVVARDAGLAGGSTARGGGTGGAGLACLGADSVGVLARRADVAPVSAALSGEGAHGAGAVGAGARDVHVAASGCSDARGDCARSNQRHSE